MPPLRGWIAASRDASRSTAIGQVEFAQTLKAPTRDDNSNGL
ncbi:MAG: hypothetical protein WAL85_03785 [Candidatus Korobacteraceae bacterium]